MREFQPLVPGRGEFRLEKRRCLCLVVGVAGSVLAACGEFSTQGAPAMGVGASTPAGAGGAGAGMNAAGAGGGLGGSAGASVVMTVDAGEDSGPMQGQGGSFTLPPGCPEPSPIGVPGQTVAIQSINFSTNEIVLRNISNSAQVIKGTRAGWQWCNFPAYWDIAPADVTLEPGETYAFLPVYNTAGVWDLIPQEGELGIYTVSGSFDEANLMVAFVSWGAGLLGGREYVATMAELWTFDEHVEIGSRDAGFIATGETNRAAGYTSVPARCLVAPPNP